MSARPWLWLLAVAALAACGGDPAAGDGGRGDGAGADSTAGLLAASAVAFTHLEQPFKGFKFDTGWVPSGSSIQVRVFVTVAAKVQAALAGRARLTRGATGLELSYAGDPSGGSFAMDLGFEMTSRLRIAVTGISWEGDVPLAPQFDYRFADKKTLTPFVLQGAVVRPVRLADTAAKKQLYQTALPGLGIPGVGGGMVTIKADGELQAALTGQKIDTTPTGSASPLTITREGQRVAWTRQGGSREEAQARYEADVTYSGVINLYPAIEVKTPIKTWTVAEFKVPIPLSSFGELATTWQFGARPVSFDLGGDGGPVP